MERRESEILTMGLEQLRALDPTDFRDVELSAAGIIHIARTFDFFWEFDYEAAKRGKIGEYHALLKSKFHSDAFLAFKMLLEIPNIRMLMAYQLARIFKMHIRNRPDRLAGVPEAATKLTQDLGRILGIDVVDIQKVQGAIKVMEPLRAGETLLGVEDLRTKGTGFLEMVNAALQVNREVKFLPRELILINRGGLLVVSTQSIDFQALAVADYRIYEWPEEVCQLCKLGSVAIKPKASDENWRLITAA